MLIRGGTHGKGGLGSKSTLSRSRMSSFGSWQCCRGFSPGTFSSSECAATSMPPPKMLDLALAEVARMAAARSERSLMLGLLLVGSDRSNWSCCGFQVKSECRRIGKLEGRCGAVWSRQVLDCQDLLDCRA